MELLTFLLTSAPVLLFVTGVIAALGKSNLRIPESLSITLNLYLLLAIGLKGGIGLASVSMDELALPLAVTLVVGILLPLVAFARKRFTKLSSRATSDCWRRNSASFCASISARARSKSA